MADTAVLNWFLGVDEVSEERERILSRAPQGQSQRWESAFDALLEQLRQHATPEAQDALYDRLCAEGTETDLVSMWAMCLAMLNRDFPASHRARPA
ncbi:MAG: hypothetical protein U0136_21920 [Bdellovibrionota bacterium]